MSVHATQRLEHDHAAAQATGRKATDTLFQSSWADLDDADLLHHFQGDRGIQFVPVIDEDDIPPERIQGIARGIFEFNGETHALPDPVPWLINPSSDIEWHILLHKFYYATGLGRTWHAHRDPAYAKRWAQLLTSWIDVTPVNFIATDVTGRRVQNWIGSLHYFVFTANGAATMHADDFRRVLHSLHAQVEHLCANLTPKRNHRTLELLAVFIAGIVFPEFQRAAAWRELALNEIVHNIHADLLIDGVHCELSTDYHHLALRNWLQVRCLARANGIDVPAAMDTALQRALVFSMHVHQPSGLAPSLSDGDVRSYLPLLAQAADLYGREDMRYVATQGRTGHAPLQRVASFAASGYHVIRSGWGHRNNFSAQQHLVFDCGPLGEGNHGHFDALSFELAAHGRALIVDPGRYTYSEAGEINWRLHFRGTAAHNTICIDGLNQTRYEPRPVKDASRHATGSVRHKVVGRAPITTLVERATSPVFDLLHGRSEGQAYNARHERVILYIDGCYWLVSDWVRAPDAHDMRLNFQLSTQAEGQTRLDSGETEARVASPGLQLNQPLRAGQTASIQAGWVSPTYGVKHPAPRFCTQAHGARLDFDTVLLLDDHKQVFTRIEHLTGDLGDTAAAIEIHGHGGPQGPCLDFWFHARDARSTHWHIRGRRFQGRWLHARFDGRGELTRVITHAGAQLDNAPSSCALVVAQVA